MKNVAPRFACSSVFYTGYNISDSDGLTVVSSIRKIEERFLLRSSYVIGCTADASDDADVILMRSGGNEIMLKPPTKDFLPNLVRRFVTNQAKEK